MSKLIRKGQLYLYGPVGGGFFDDAGFTDSDVIDALGKLSGDITVRLNSPGGSVFQGIAIHSLLIAHAGTVTVHIDALAASAASVIACAGDTVIMSPGAQFMIHDPSQITWGGADDHRRAATALDSVARSAARIYSAKSGQSIEQCLSMMAVETWLGSDDAVSAGFADAVSGDAADPQLAAFPRFDYGVFNHAPAPVMMASIASTEKDNPMNKPLPKDDPTGNARDDIMALCERYDLTTPQTRKIMRASGDDMNAARDMVLEALAARQPTASLHHPQIGGDEDASAAMVEALATRLAPELIKPTQGNPYIGMRVPQMIRAFAEGRGENLRRLSDDDIVMHALSGRRGPSSFSMSGGHATSDFPSLLQGAGNRVLLERFKVGASALKLLSSERSASDFRPQSHIRPGEAPRLDKVAENAEITSGTLGEEEGSYKLDTYAKKFALSRQALVNDDLDAFADFMSAFAASASGTEGDLFYAILSANSFAGKTLTDGTALFHADRGNLAASGAALSVTTLGAARKAMRLQKDVNKTGRAGVVPKYLLVGPALETVAEQLIASINAATVEDVNPFGGKLSLLVEDRYEGNGWWLFADPATEPAFVHAYLDGRAGPQVEMREGWDVLGVEFRCILDFGCGVREWRAAYRNPGA